MMTEPRVTLRHDWVAVATFSVPAEDVEDLAKAKGPFHMGDDSIRDCVGPVCLRCQIEYADAPESCPGEVTGYGRDGTPVYA